jgi:hypothetical protein
MGSSRRQEALTLPFLMKKRGPDPQCMREAKRALPKPTAFAPVLLPLHRRHWNRHISPFLPKCPINRLVSPCLPTVFEACLSLRERAWGEWKVTRLFEQNVPCAPDPTQPSTSPPKSHRGRRNLPLELSQPSALPSVVRPSRCTPRQVRAKNCLRQFTGSLKLGP